MVRDSNNTIGGFERLLKKYIHLDSFMYNLILPFENCVTFIKRMRYVTPDNKLHNGT